MNTIVLAEDHLQMRDILASIIRNQKGYQLTFEAENGYQLLLYLNTSKKIPAIALVDVQMPVMDGLAVTHYINHCYPTIKVMAVSTHTHPSLVQDMLESGAMGYIVKENFKHSLPTALSALNTDSIFIDKMIGNYEFKKSKNCRKPLEIISTGPMSITKREGIFLQLCATSISFDQIANLMNVANDSVYNYQKSLKEKLGIYSRQELTIYALQNGYAKIARLNI